MTIIGVNARARDGAGLESSYAVNVDNVANDCCVLNSNWLVIGRGRGGEEMDDTLAGADGQGMGGQSHILSLLQGL